MGNHGSDPAALEMMPLAGAGERLKSTAGAAAQADLLCVVRVW